MKSLAPFLFLCLSVSVARIERVTEPHYVGEGCTVSVIVSAVNVMHSCGVPRAGGPAEGGTEQLTC